jgi:hypothetical protein
MVVLAIVVSWPPSETMPSPLSPSVVIVPETMSISAAL